MIARTSAGRTTPEVLTKTLTGYWELCISPEKNPHVFYSLVMGKR